MTILNGVEQSCTLNSPVIQIDCLKTKFDTVVISNSLIALLDHNYNEARFLQQLHYWSYSEYGVVIDGIRWIFKPISEWLNEVLVGLTEWKLRKVIASLLEKNLIRREKLFARHQKQEYKSFWWQPKNQTYYYSINYEELGKLIEKAESIESIRIEDSTELSIEKIKTTKSCELSQNNTKSTKYKNLTTKQLSDRINQNSSIAAAQQKNTSKREKTQSNTNHHSDRLTTFSNQIKQKSTQDKSNLNKEKEAAKIDYIVNKKWKELIPLLDSAGVPINRTIKDLLKLYPAEKVEGAIALVRARKREQHIPNPSGYFVSALKGDWSSQNIVESDLDRQSSEVDKGAVFRHWYDLSRELGYCSGQEIREGQQWVCLSGSWEKWESALERGYSLEYLKKIMKRNQNS
ncbi:hypothetical protein I4641_02320 [Waterburya agarophytonicola K14]|uniref:Uncharacterized protein n=1 Tax=Waterburya agarophytonicola KI4 TaxID=2874699 RepID=A0A964BPK4_9CYAN|nr:hypothetical protein [Waterburya agarophytonicola]MCC0175816.1 hypothetical protein [Waterburya agarophytonicola KI4]